MYIIYWSSQKGDPSCIGPYESKLDAVKNICKFLQIITDKCGVFYIDSGMPYIKEQGYMVDYDKKNVSK